jgi:hypothetical protein
MERDAVYFSRRANEERIAAMRAEHPQARQAHLEMAKRYRELTISAPPDRLAASPDVISAA